MKYLLKIEEKPRHSYGRQSCLDGELENKIEECDEAPGTVAQKDTPWVAESRVCDIRKIKPILLVG